MNDHVVDRVFRIIVPGALLETCPERDELGHLGLDDLDAPLLRQRVVATGGYRSRCSRFFPAFASGTCWN
ncbi:MAG: hypothetical protein WBH47_13350 [Streptosporangiaceae bacterium]